MTERKLHIGGQKAAEGWEILNALDADYVDHCRDARDLSCFEDDTFTAIYASHVVEHFDYAKSLLPTLKEWHRVLKPGAHIYVSVPDLDTLAQMFLQKDQHTANERFYLMRVMFGGQMDEYDFHYVGFNSEILCTYLNEAGFSNFRRVGSFGLFQDTSEIRFKNVPLSLNIIAEKSGPAPASAQ